MSYIFVLVQALKDRFTFFMSILMRNKSSKLNDKTRSWRFRERLRFGLKWLLCFGFGSFIFMVSIINTWLRFGNKSNMLTVSWKRETNINFPCYSPVYFFDPFIHTGLLFPARIIAVKRPLSDFTRREEMGDKICSPRSVSLYVSSDSVSLLN